MPGHDYRAWNCPQRVWNSIDEFLTGDKWLDGIHTILTDGVPLDLLIHGAPFVAGMRVIPVFFSGAVTDRANKQSPFFSGLGLARTEGFPAICVADPAISLEPDLGLAWYSGHPRHPTPELLVRVLRGIADRARCELLLVGGSGGGFAALYYGQALGPSASVLVWNPQTDFLEYEESATRKYLGVLLPEVDLAADGAAFRNEAAELLRVRGQPHSVLPTATAGMRPRRLLYLQNASDWHVSRHAAPFLEAVGSSELGRGFHRTGADGGLLWFGNWGSGHEPAPRELIAFAVKALLDPSWSPTELPGELATSPFADFVDPASAPRALREPVPELRVLAQSDGKALRVKASLDDVESGTGQITFAFYVYSGHERIAVRWYKSAGSYIHDEISGKSATRVLAFVRDGFGRQLPVREIPVVPGKSIYVLGSCVSRDAFELARRDDLFLAGYLARSSLASAFDTARPPAAVAEFLGKLSSTWQRRMVENDLHRRAVRLLSEARFDGLLLDLIDERFSLLEVEGALVTASVEFRKTHYPVDQHRLVPPGSAEHLKAWEKGVDRLLTVVRLRPVIVNRVFWATRDDHGNFLADQEKIGRHNEMLAKMYVYLEGQVTAFINYPDDLLVADSKHKWGVSPFHYIGLMYEHTTSELHRLVQSDFLPDRS